MIGSNVIVVDDDQAFLEALTIFLEDHGYCVKKAVTAQEGFAALQDGPLDLAIVDVHLPDQQGVEVVKKLKESSPDTPVVMVSSDHSEEITQRCYRANADLFLRKPISPKYLIEMIARQLDHSKHPD